MNRLISSLKLVLLITNFTLAQTVDNLVNGPLVGFTFAPTAKRYAISADVFALSTNTIYDKFGREKTYKDLIKGKGNPKRAITAYSIDYGYSFNNNAGFLAIVPFISKQELKMNTIGSNKNITDLTGETGMGDMTIGGWYFFSKSRTNRSMVLGLLTLATGSSPEDVSENNLSPTGSGTYSYSVFAVSDFMTAPNTLVSFATGFTINNEASFSSGDQKKGNGLQFSGRVSYQALPESSVGLVFNYFFKNKTEIDNEKIDDSNSDFTSIMPIIGFLFPFSTTTITISGGYLLFLTGTNQPKFTGFTGSVLISF